MDFKIAVIKGDGVGTEIVDEGLKVLDKIAQNTTTNLNIQMY